MTDRPHGVPEHAAPITLPADAWLVVPCPLCQRQRREPAPMIDTRESQPPLYADGTVYFPAIPCHRCRKRWTLRAPLRPDVVVRRHDDDDPDTAGPARVHATPT